MATYYWIGGNGTWDGSNTTNWSDATGGSGGFGPPLSTDTVVFDSASGTGTCTTASGSACATATLNSSTLALTLGANHTMSGVFTLTLGTLSLGTYTLTSLTFVSNNSNARTIDFGTGDITITGSGVSVWNLATNTNISILGTPVVNATYAGATGTRSLQNGVTAGALETNAVSFNISAGTDAITLSGSSKNVNFTGFSGTLNLSARSIYGNLIVSSGMTVTAGGSATTFAATSGTQQITTNGKTLDFPVTLNGVGGTLQLQDNCTVGSTRTVTLTNGTLDLNNQTLSCGLFSSNNSNTRSIAFGTGNITLTGNNAGVFVTTDATNLTLSGTPTVNLTYSGATGTRQISCSSTSASQATAFNFNVSAGTDIVTFGTGTARVANNVDFTGFSGTISDLVKNIYGNLTLASTNLFVASTSTVTFAATSGTKTITTAGLSLDFPITFNGVNGTWSFADALTQGSTRAFTITNGTVKLKAGATSTVGAFATSGSNQKYLQSTTAGSQATLSQASGTVTVSYLSIKDIAATGGATWNAYVDYNNVDQGDNTGWDFSNSPAIDNEFPIALRSFTQPKRF